MFSCCKESSNDSEIIVYHNDMRKTLKSTDLLDKQLLTSILSNQQGNYQMIINSTFQDHYHRCKQKKSCFNDEKFPPNNKSLGTKSSRDIIWKRVTEIIENPVLVQDGIQPADVQQGKAGDCYFLACISSLAQNPQNIYDIFDNSMEINQFGIYKINLNWEGQPRQIIIDDYIPVFKDNPKRTVFCKPKDKEVWVLLIEKAWAKICGSYGATEIGHPHEVLNTFTFAPCFSFDISLETTKEDAQKIWKILVQAEKYKYPVCSGSRKRHTCKGIKSGHTYSLLNSYTVKRLETNYRILKLRNPWGQFQYTSAYSQSDENFWNAVDKVDRRRVFGNEQDQNDGVFTLQFEQFLTNFEVIDCAHVRSGFNYAFHTITAQNSKPYYYEFTLTQLSCCYITLEKDRIDQSIHIAKDTTGEVKLILAKRRNQDEVAETQFAFITLKRQSAFTDVTLHCQKLEPGQYIVYAQVFSSEASTAKATISTYSSSRIDIIPSKLDSLRFLDHVFFDHATNNPNKTFIKGESNDWICIESFFQQFNIGYFCCNLPGNSDLKIQIYFNREQLEKEGYVVINKKVKNYSKQLKKGQGDIVLFSRKTESLFKQNFIFPPKSFNVKYLI